MKPVGVQFAIAMRPPHEYSETLAAARSGRPANIAPNIVTTVLNEPLSYGRLSASPTSNAMESIQPRLATAPGNQICGDVDARHRGTGPRRGQGQVSGAARNVEHAFSGIEAESRDELTRALLVAFRNATEVA